MEIVFLLVGLAVGALAAGLVARSRIARTDAELELERRSRAASESSRLEIETTLKALSADLHKEGRDDLASRQRAIEQMLTPLKESIDGVNTRMQGIERVSSTAQGALGAQIRELVEAQARLQAETSSLAGSLRSTGVRGRWGEMQLRRVAELAGMVAYCDFEEQRTVSADGRTLRPDLVVRLPGGRNVVVDAKVPFDAYILAASAATEEERRQHLAEHAKALRGHVSQLGAKAYWEPFEPTPGFVVLFVPAEALFHAALEHDPGLMEDAMRQGVLLASPASLIALLRAVAEGWRQETMADNAREVSRLGQQLYDRIATFAEHLVKLRKGMDGAVTAYNDAIGSLERSVLPAARRFPDLGVPGTKQLPALEPIQQATRATQAPELAARPTARDDSTPAADDVPDAA